MKSRNGWMVGMALWCGLTLTAAAAPLKVLIVTGQNNHDWKSCTPMMQRILESSGRFVVTVSTTPPAKSSAEQWAAWQPVFKGNDVVLSDYNGEDWPEAVRTAFTDYVRSGGGLVIVHAADNSFPKWPEFNAMIGVGGWGGRNERSGPMLRWRNGQIERDTSPGAGGTHGAQHEFVVETRVAEHPIMRGLPAKWKHASDELYSKLRGPATNLTVLATAYAAPETRGTGEHEPILMTIAFGQGRVFHTVLGHGPAAMSSLGFQVTLLRGTEWAATGAVTFPPVTAEALPADRVASGPVKP